MARGPLLITSRANDRVRAALRLRDRATRERERRILVEGAREIERAVAAGVEVLEGYVCPELRVSDEARRAARLLDETARERFDVTPGVFEKLAYGDRSDGVIAVARTPELGLGRLEVPQDGLVGVLEAVEKPGNLGAALRTADGAGLDALLVADPATDLYNPNAIRASLGAIFAVPVAAAPSADVAAWLREQRFAIVAARVGATRRYTDVDMTGATALVLGSEAHGLSDAWAGSDIVEVSVPMHGVGDSLNVSVSAAILFYEALRQRRHRADRVAP